MAIRKTKSSMSALSLIGGRRNGSDRLDQRPALAVALQRIVPALPDVGDIGQQGLRVENQAQIDLRPMMQPSRAQKSHLLRHIRDHKPKIIRSGIGMCHDLFWWFPA